MSAADDAPTVGFQGAAGANGERAISAWWGRDARAVPLRSFSALLAAVADGTVSYGVVPIWNSTAGALREPSEALLAANGRLEQIGELTVPVRHALLGAPGGSLQELRVVGSHPAALAQCGGFLARHPSVVAAAAWDTSGAAAELAALVAGRPAAGTPWYAHLHDTAPRELAAIANESLAGRYGLSVLARDIHDDPRNATRFAVVRARRSERR